MQKQTPANTAGLKRDSYSVLAKYKKKTALESASMPGLQGLLLLWNCHVVVLSAMSIFQSLTIAIGFNQWARLFQLRKKE